MCNNIPRKQLILNYKQLTEFLLFLFGMQHLAQSQCSTVDTSILWMV